LSIFAETALPAAALQALRGSGVRLDDDEVAELVLRHAEATASAAA